MSSAFLNIAMIIVSIALIAIIIFQGRGAGLGGLGGGASDFTGGARVRRGIERLLFNLTIGLSAAFLILAVLNVIFVG